MRSGSIPVFMLGNVTYLFLQLNCSTINQTAFVFREWTTISTVMYTINEVRGEFLQLSNLAPFVY